MNLPAANPGTIKRIAALALTIAIFGGFAFILWTTKEFQDCLEHQHVDHVDRAEKPKADNQQPPAPTLTDLAIADIKCAAHFLDEHEGAVTALGTLFIALFTLTLWQSTKKLWREAESSRALARDEFIAAHPPRIRLKHIFVNGTVAGESPLNYDLVFVNVGDATANIVEIGLATVVVDQDKPLPPRPAFGAPLPLRLPLALAKGMAYSFQACGADTFTKEVKNQIIRRVAKFYVYGYVQYTDFDGRFRKTAFCRVLFFAPGGERLQRIATNDDDYEYEE